MVNLDLRMKSWLAVNDVSYYKDIQQPLFINLATSNQTVVSQGLIVGSKKQGAVDADDNIRQALQTYNRDSNEVKEAVKVAPTTGLTTILDIARIVSNFNPSLPNDPNNINAYSQYVTKILQNPLMHLLSNSRKIITRHTSDWNGAIDQIANLYEGVSASDKGKIIESLRTLAKVASSFSKTKQTESLFTQSTINCDDSIDVYIYSSTVTMEETSSGKHDVKQVSFDILTTQIRFNKELWDLYSDAVLAKHLALMDDWLNGIDTKVETEKTKLAYILQPSSKSFIN